MNALPLPPLAAVLRRPRREAEAAFAGLGWRPWVPSVALDAERRRTLNVDLTEPELAFGAGAAIRAVAHFEIDIEGLVTVVEVVATDPAEPGRVAAALLPGRSDEPRLGGGAEAREWIWGPESGSRAAVDGEPIRLWICAERAYADRLWLVATVVRRAGDDQE